MVDSFVPILLDCIRNIFFMKAIVFALLASVFYGLSSPVVKVAFNKGMHPDGFAFSYGVSLLLMTLFTLVPQGIGALYASPSALLWGAAAGILCTLGLKTSAIAFSIPTSLVAVVTAVMATYPAISSLMSLSMLGEAHKVILPKLMLGILLVISGGYLASTSIK